MGKQQLQGFTLMEILVVTAVVGLVLGAVLALSMQSAKLFARTSSRVEPQQSQLLALKRMERELREALVIDLNSNPTAIEVIQPLKDANNLNILNGDNLQAGKRVCFFLGRKNYYNPSDKRLWVAVPDPLGNTIFRMEKTSGSFFPLASYYLKNTVKTIVTGLSSTPMVTGPSSPGTDVPTTLFQFKPMDNNGTPSDPTDDNPVESTSIIKITLTIPVRQMTASGQVLTNQTLATQFHVRNFISARPGT